MKVITEELLKEVIDSFDFKGTLLEKKVWGNGHINDTYLLMYKQEQKNVRYILQKGAEA